MKAPLRLCLWSGPRNVSTALMYSFAQRHDTTVVDEPLYAYYLARSGVDHPGRQDVLDSQDTDGDAVVRNVVLGPCSRDILFLKQMAHHLEGLDRQFLKETVNVLLVRDPREMLLSLRNQIPNPVLRDTGLGFQSELLEQLVQLGQPGLVLDSRRLLQDPRRVLSSLCERLGIPFLESMLRWDAGPRPEDGVWAPHWYANVHRSTGFQEYRPKSEELPAALVPLHEECRPHYEALLSHAI